MKYLSVCSGIEAASVAWHPLGWEPLAFSEIEPFPRAVLEHHYPHVPLHGDFTVLRDEPWIVDADVLVGGTPCQAFSVAGLRNSLADERGNLSLEFVRLADAIDDLRLRAGREPAVIVWENVPGVLSVKDNAFGCFLAALAGDAAPYDPPRGKWTNAGVVDGPARTVAWRILDAQYFGLAQRRRRVFVVASARDGFDPAAVLFEFEGVRRDTPPRRETRQDAATIPSRSTAGGGLGTDFDCDGGVITLAHGQGGAEVARERSPTLTCNHEAPIAAYITHSLRAEGFDASEKPGKARDGEPLAFLEAHVSYADDDCLVWPFGRFKSGYGCVGRNGRAHRVMCELAHGPAPEQADAAHSCGNRLCVNPRHLRWASRAENMADAIAHGRTTRGERHGANKLTEDDVRVILERLAECDTHQEIADDYGVARTTITDIAKGKNWAWLREDGTGRGTPLVPVAVPIQEVGKRTGTSTDDPRAGIGIGQDGDPMFTLQAGAQHGVAAYAFQPRIARNGRGDMGEIVNALNAQSGETGKGDAAPCVATINHGDHYADAAKAGPIEALRALRRAVGEEAFTVWAFGSLAAFQPAEVLQSALHGCGLRPAAFSRSWMVCCALGGAEHGTGWLLQSLRETGCEGCPPQGWEPSEQLAGELGAYLPKLSQPGASTESLMRDLWLASEGPGVLQQALAAVQAMGRSAGREGQSAPPVMAVRRLTATECEFLQGFPRGYTNIPWRGKPESPDGPRYKALGNSMAVPCMAWIGRRIAAHISAAQNTTEAAA